MNRGFSQYGTAASLLTADGHSLHRNKSHCFRLPHEAVKPTLEDATKGVADALSVRFDTFSACVLQSPSRHDLDRLSKS